MKHDIQIWVASCTSCASRKTPTRLQVDHMEPIPVQEAFEIMGMDIVGPLPRSNRGNVYLLVFTEYLTKWAEAFPIMKTDALSIAKVLVEEIICRYGAPKRIISDQGSNFISAVIANICTTLGIQRNITTAYHPQTDGLTERFNKTLASMISMYTSRDQKDWDEHVPFILFAYRTAIQESTLEKPFYLMFGRDPQMPVDIALNNVPGIDLSVDDYRSRIIYRVERARKVARENIVRAQKRQQDNYEKLGHPREFMLGDQVWVFTPKVVKGTAKKFAHNWYGPFRVIEKISPLNYRIRSNSGKKVEQIVHILRMKKFIGGTQTPTEIPEEIPEEEECELFEDELPVPESRIEPIRPVLQRNPNPVIPIELTEPEPMESIEPVPMGPIEITPMNDKQDIQISQQTNASTHTEPVRKITKIIGKARRSSRGKQGNPQYEVLWDDGSRSWEFAENQGPLHHAIKEYEQAETAKSQHRSVDI